MTDAVAFPGPAALGRGLVVGPGEPLPPPSETWPRLTIDEAVLSDPVSALAQLDAWWRTRTPSCVVLGVGFRRLMAPETTARPPYDLSPSFEFHRERLHFLTWINRYDGRGGLLRWHHGERALAGGARTGDGQTGDVVVDGQPVWIDGGPRSVHPGLAVVHVETVWAASLQRDRPSSAVTGLAPDQTAAADHRDGPARIVAPAGSGKTRVLTARMRHLIEDRGWNGDVVTALAYNRRAAAEMSARLADLPAAHIRTLHAFGYEIVGRNRGSRPRLMPERDVRRVLDRLAPIRPRANEDVHAPYLEALAEVRTALVPPERVEAERDDVPGLATMFVPFRREMRDRGAMDHDEQIYGALEALLTDTELRAWAQGRCRHLLVDEFQDLTPAHLLLIRLLSAPGYDVFGVGDDDQVIYGYAGADPAFLLDYTAYFPGASEYLLEVNYRCPVPVVAAATNLLAHNQRRVAKRTRAASEITDGLAVELATEERMGDTLAGVVERLLEQAPPEDIAVLTRVNVGLLVPQITLGERGLAADRVLDESLLTRSGVRSALAWLRLASAVASGDQMDGADLNEATRRPPRGLSPGVRTALGRGEWGIDRLAAFAEGSDDGRTRQRLFDLVDDISTLAHLVANGRSVAEQLTTIRDGIGLGAVLDRLDNSRARPTGGHTDDLDALTMLAHTHPGVTAFEPWLQGTLASPPPQGPAITLATVHRVKGLEWPHVIVWDASVGLMPHRLAVDIEEERRIFHVAVTRCSRSVTVISRAAAPSPFVDQLERPPTLPATTRAVGSLATVAAEPGLRFRWQGYEVVVTGSEREAAVVRVGTASRMRIRWGETVEVGGKRMKLAQAPSPEPDGELMERLREWRRRRAGADGVPPYVVAHDAHLESIATRRPSNLGELAECDGIGPARLDRYGDEILDVMGG